MPMFRKRYSEFPAIKFTGDNYKIVETWGTAFGVKVCQFLTEPGVPYVLVDEGDGRPLWEAVPAGWYIARFRTDNPPILMEAARFEEIYEEDL